MDKDFLLFSPEGGGTYLYDSNTNTVHPLPCEMDENWIKALYDTPEGDPLPPGDLPAGLKTYFSLWRKQTDAFQRLPLLERNRIADMESAEKIQISSGLPCDMILVVTEQCNLRCAYCVYEEGLYANRREHTSQYMDRSTARKAIDLYFSRNAKDVYKPLALRAMNLVFYGGEPLLNWEVVSDATAYARERHNGTFPLYIGMTSNLTLLKKEWLPFLRDHDFFINVSLDGPREEHDRYRRFAGGQPTFDTVYRNLEMIREFDEEYFQRNVKAAVTCNGNTRFEQVVDFFDFDPNSPQVYTVSQLKDLETGRFHQIHPFDRNAWNQSKLALREQYRQRLEEEGGIPRGSALYALVYDGQCSHFCIPHSISGRLKWYTGACLPGRKLAVTPDGNIHPCERTAMDYPVGNVNEGLDEKKLLEYFNGFFASTDQCSSCWARARCTLCPAAVDSLGQLEFENRCRQARRSIELSLMEEYVQLEKTPGMFAGEFPYY